MRIISGLYGGKILNIPKQISIRPTTDKAKEALFNILQNHIEFEKISFVDLFAGTGSISFEIASRGCIDITSVEKNKQCIAFIKKTARELHAPVRIIQKNVFSFLQRPFSADIVFADSPFKYDVKYYENLLHLIQKNNYAKENKIILEHSSIISLNEFSNFYDRRCYGSVCFTFFCKKNIK